MSPAVEAMDLQSKAVLVGGWRPHEEFPIHPIGSKPKQILICPPHHPEPFLIPGHPYLFKTAEGWRGQQIWSEIIAYQIAALVGLNVPPCFLAMNEHTGQVGALIEFFYGKAKDTGCRPALIFVLFGLHLDQFISNFRAGFRFEPDTDQVEQCVGAYPGTSPRFVGDCFGDSQQLRGV
jgi:hypothetical protein